MNNSDYIYFDIASTTPVHSVVLDKMHEINKNYFGNCSSIHQIGQKAHNLIERSRKNIASLLGCLESEIIFTSGGTESNNMALRGILSNNDHFITSTYEHPSILNVAKSIEKEGVEVTYIKPNKYGVIEIDDIKNAIKILKAKEFFVINSDIIWEEKTNSPFDQLNKFWNKDKMDALLLLYPKKKNRGDYNINKSNRIIIDKNNPKYIFTGIQILKSKIFLKIKKKNFLYL